MKHLHKANGLLDNISGNWQIHQPLNGMKLTNSTSVKWSEIGRFKKCRMWLNWQIQQELNGVKLTDSASVEWSETDRFSKR
jgi:hypothetical protein